MFRSRCHRPQEKLNSIECNISTNQISFLLLSSCSSESNVNPILNDLALGFNGYITMKFVNVNGQSNETSLYINYKNLNLDDKGELTDKNPLDLVHKEWSVDANGNVVLVKLEPINRELTIGSNIDTRDSKSLSLASNCCITL